MQMQESLKLFNNTWLLIFMGVAVVVIVGVGGYLWRRDEKEGGYEQLGI